MKPVSENKLAARSLLWGTAWSGIYVAVQFVLEILRGLVIPYIKSV